MAKAPALRFSLYPFRMGSLAIVLCRFRFRMPRKRKRYDFWNVVIGRLWIAWRWI